MSAKLIGKVDWVIQPDSPELSGQEGDETVTVKVTATSKGLVNLPQYGAPFESKDPFFAQFSYLVLTGRSVRLDKGGKTYSVTLTYGTSEGSENNTEAVVRREVEYSTQDADIPLAQHPNYRVRWNHVLIAKKGTASSPSWWTNASDKAISSDDAGKYAWAKPDEKVPEGWYCLLAETKRGVEAYRSGICTVSEISRSTNKSYLERSAAKDYTIQTPPDTFGRPGQWLRGGSSIRKSGRYWELSVSYLNSKKWDEELYNT